MAIREGAMAEDERGREVRRLAERAETVLRLLWGESLDVFSRELRAEARRLAARRDELLAAGTEDLEARPRAPDQRRTAERPSARSAS